MTSRIARNGGGGVWDQPVTMVMDGLTSGGAREMSVSAGSSY